MWQRDQLKKIEDRNEVKSGSAKGNESNDDDKESVTNKNQSTREWEILKRLRSNECDDCRVHK